MKSFLLRFSFVALKMSVFYTIQLIQPNYVHMLGTKQTNDTQTFRQL